MPPFQTADDLEQDRGLQDCTLISKTVKNKLVKDRNVMLEDLCGCMCVGRSSFHTTTAVNKSRLFKPY